MKKIVFLLLAAISVAVSISSCSDSETYADQKKRERSAINKYISENNIKVLSEAEFNSNGQVTDTANKE